MPGLKWLRRAILDLQMKVLTAEDQRNLDLSRPIPIDFVGLVLAWYHGTNLGELAERSRLAEGDLVMIIQKTIDLCRQVRQALRRADPTHPLIPCLGLAESGLRRGVIESCYRWALGLPAEESGEDAEEADPSATPVVA